MKIFVNGEPREVLTARTVADLVVELDLPGPALLIEHNGTALHRAEWPRAPLQENDRLECLRVTAGG